MRAISVQLLSVTIFFKKNYCSIWHLILYSRTLADDRLLPLFCTNTDPLMVNHRDTLKTYLLFMSNLEYSPTTAISVDEFNDDNTTLSHSCIFYIRQSSTVYHCTSLSLNVLRKCPINNTFMPCVK
jgi:hypothetical protein